MAIKDVDDAVAVPEIRRRMELGPLDDAFGYLLRRAWRDVSRSFGHHFRELDITAPQYSILILLDRNAQCAPGDLVAPLGIGQNNLVGIIGDLIRRGLVKKATNPYDRRARILTLTPAGREMLAAAHEAHDRYTAEYEERIGAERIGELTRILRMFDRG